MIPSLKKKKELPLVESQTETQSVGHLFQVLTSLHSLLAFAQSPGLSCFLFFVLCQEFTAAI